MDMGGIVSREGGGFSVKARYDLSRRNFVFSGNVDE